MRGYFISLPVSLAKTGKYRIPNQSMLSANFPRPSAGKEKLVVYFLELTPKSVYIDDV